jgi:hypothetical protein
MENNLLNEEIERISEIMGINSKSLIKESLIDLERLLGRQVADAVELGFGKTLAHDLEFALMNALKSSSNIIEKNGVKYLKSAMGNEVPMSKLSQIVKDVAEGRLSGSALDQELNSLPRQLQDGSDFRETIGRRLKDKSASVQGGGGSSSIHGGGSNSGGGSSIHGGGSSSIGGGGGLGSLPRKFTVYDLMTALKSDHIFADIMSKPDVESKLKSFIESEIKFKGLSVEELWTNQKSIHDYMARAEEAFEKAGEKSKTTTIKIGNFLESLTTSKRAKQALGLLIIALLAGLITVNQLKNKAKEIIGTDTENNTDNNQKQDNTQQQPKKGKYD